MPFSAIKVANEFLRLAREDNPPRSFTPLQLLKLVYIAHGFSLVYMKSPLLSESPQAWQYGPVVPSLYYAIRQYGADAITASIGGDTDPQGLSEEAKSLIAAVYKQYGHLSGIQLSNMTHQQNTPWSQTWNEAGKNAVISNNVIQAHYKEIVSRAA
jgi:uncharacterized phage-associated protein